MKNKKQSPEMATTPNNFDLLGEAINLLNRLNCAGYNNDRATFNKLFRKNEIPHDVAERAYKSGYAMKQAGIPCICSRCIIKSQF